MSQVRNLRAMFEGKGDDASPPDRGRSPGSRNPVSESPRRLSKVRSAFVAIEKDGQLGLCRDTSLGTSPSRQRSGSDLDAESSRSSEVVEDTTLGKPQRPFHDNLTLDLAKSPARPLGTRHTPDNNDSATVDTPSLSLLKAEDEKHSPTHPPSLDPTRKSSPRGPVVAPKLDSRKTDSVPTSTNSLDGDVIITVEDVKRPTQRKPVSTTRNPRMKSPVNNQRSTPTKSEVDPKHRLKNTGSVTPRDPRVTASDSLTTPPTHSTSPLRLAGRPLGPSGKLHPRPTTKPANVAASRMAPAVSSDAKVDSSRHVPSRQRGPAHPKVSSERSLSRTSVSTTGVPARTLKHQSSTINRPRPSIGLPPQKNVQNGNQALQKGGHVDQDFLARMMRPTQASSSKTSEKAPITPPRNRLIHQSTSFATRSSERKTNKTEANSKCKTIQAIGRGSQNSVPNSDPVDATVTPSDSNVKTNPTNPQALEGPSEAVSGDTGSRDGELSATQPLVGSSIVHKEPDSVTLGVDETQSVDDIEPIGEESEAAHPAVADSAASLVDHVTRQPTTAPPASEHVGDVHAMTQKQDPTNAPSLSSAEERSEGKMMMANSQSDSVRMESQLEIERESDGGPQDGDIRSDRGENAPQVGQEVDDDSASISATGREEVVGRISHSRAMLT